MRSTLVLALAASTATAAVIPIAAAGKRVQPQTVAPRVPGGRVTVTPVLFVPQGTPRPDAAVLDAAVAQHLSIAREHYRDLLGTTFAVTRGSLSVLDGQYDDSAYLGSERADRIMSELLAWRRTDRYRSTEIFLVLYASSGTPISGGGLPFNGAPGTGGGYIEMDLASLTTDYPYPFQSTLVHELGHAFGLPHAECFGSDQATASSIMSYDPAHWSSGTSQSATRGDFSPEDRAMLAMNQRVFPGLRYDAKQHGAVDLQRVQQCFIPPVSSAVSPLEDLIGVGFELYYDGERVNGPDAALYSRAQATDTCATSRAWYPNVRVECRYNGAAMR